MSENIKLQVAKFEKGFIIQILEQNMKFTRKHPDKLFPNGWSISSRGFPYLNFSKKVIFLRGNMPSKDYEMLAYVGDDSEEILNQVLTAIKAWSRLEDESSLGQSENFFEISF